MKLQGNIQLLKLKNHALSVRPDSYRDVKKWGKDYSEIYQASDFLALERVVME